MKNTKKGNWSPARSWRKLATAVVLMVGALSWAAAQQAPKIVSTTPAIGTTDVDPGLKEITVTFDQDMRRGMSWTGGGPEFPDSPSGAKARWVDKRTCALPVTLVPGHRYRVGINAPSFHNFQSESGVAVAASAITFSTRGTPAKAPKIVAINPRNGTNNVSPALRS